MYGRMFIEYLIQLYLSSFVNKFPLLPFDTSHFSHTQNTQNFCNFFLILLYEKWFILSILFEIKRQTLAKFMHVSATLLSKNQLNGWILMVNTEKRNRCKNLFYFLLSNLCVFFCCTHQQLNGMEGTTMYRLK